MKKRMMGLLLATAMVIGASMTAFAAGNSVSTSVTHNDNVTVGGLSLTFESTIHEKPIQVTVKRLDKVVINPYRALITYKGIDDVNVSSNDTLIAEPIVFTNNSEVPVAVDLKGQIVLGTSGVTVAASKDAIATSTTKQVYVKAMFTDEKVKPDAKGLLPATANVFWSGTKSTAGVVSFAKGADVVYTAAGTASMAAPPVLAAKGAAVENSGEVETLYVVFTGGVSVDPKVQWDATANKFDVLTTYDLKFVGESKVPSRFRPAATLPAKVLSGE